MRRRLTLFALVLTCACRSLPVSSLTGKWHASSSGLSVDLAIVQRNDSLSGTGTYALANNSSLGCGGESIPATGPVTLSGKLSATSFQGRMSFAGTWTPPYLGTFVAPDSLNGHFMSVDRGGCPLILLRQSR